MRPIPRILVGALLAAWMVAAQAPPAPATAPAIFDVSFKTTGGVFVIEAHRDWAPLGADRFYELAKSGYYNGNAFYRVVPKFMVQWGLSPDPAATARWSPRTLADDPVRQHNVAGMVAFAAHGPHSRATQVFVNLGPNLQLDRDGFAPFGKVVKGIEVVRNFYADYGDIPPAGEGPDQAQIARQGAAYLTKNFPRLDVVLSTTVTPGPAGQ